MGEQTLHFISFDGARVKGLTGPTLHLVALSVVAVAFGALAGCVSNERVDVLSPHAATVQTSACRIEISGGTLNRVTNRLTDEAYGSQDAEAATCCRFESGEVFPEEPAAESSECVKLGPGCVAFTSRNATAKLSTQFTTDARTGDIIVSQEASSGDAGLESVGFAVTGLDMDMCELLVPHASGRAVDWASNPGGRQFHWPTHWEIQFALIQGKRGGIMVRAEDVERCAFKRLRVEREGNVASLCFETICPAPFEQRKSVRSARWRLTAYRGNWQDAARIYRQWAERACGLTPISRRADWIRDIRFVVIMGQQAELLPELAKWAPPQSTLLYLPGWRADGYDRNYPEYSTFVPSLMPFLREAKRMGFRVMLHVNYFGCDPLNPLYQKFEPWQMVSRGQKQWWLWPHDPVDYDIRFAYINPACAEWRRTLTGRLKKLCDRTGVDALHLDQTLCVYNDERGLIEGLNSTQGNVLLHRQMLQAAPDVALSGEGLNEVTFRNEHFAQRHVAGINHSKGTWDDEQIDLAHPLCSAVLRPYNLIYGYLGMCNPDNTQLWRAWKRAYANWGVIPTLPRPHLDQLRNPKGDALALKRELKLWVNHDPVPDFDTPWPQGTRLLYRTRNGDRIAWRDAKPGCTELVLMREGADDEIIVRTVRGVTQTEIEDWHLTAWPAYDGNRSFGLDPTTTYLAEPGAYDEEALHLCALPEQTTLAQFRMNRYAVVVSLEPAMQAAAYDFIEHIAQATTGIMKDGRELPLGEGASFRAIRGWAGERSMRAIHAHPPWKGTPGQKVKGRGQTFGDFRLRIPEEGARLLFCTALQDGAKETDGADFTVTADGKQVFSHNQTETVWTPHEVDLSRFAGREVVVRFLTGPGPAGDVSWDWALWGRPRLMRSAEQHARKLALSTTGAVQCVLHREACVTSPPRERRGKRNVYPVRCDVPDQVVFVVGDPVAAACPLDLTNTPCGVTRVIDGISSAPTGFAARKPGSGVCGSSRRVGMMTHPPNNGRLYVDYLLSLPAASRLSLSFGCGIADGSKDGSVRFSVEANGREIWNRRFDDPAGWHDAVVDLTPYAGKVVLLSLAVDSLGPWNYDWAWWAEPKVTAD